MRNDGSLFSSPNAILQIDTNTISDNGQTTTFSASGLVMRIGSADGGSASYFSNDPGDEVGVGAPYGSSSTSLGLFGAISARTNARVVGNSFEGNFGDDFQVIPFVFTTDPGHTTGTWRDFDDSGNPAPVFAVGNHNRFWSTGPAVGHRGGRHDAGPLEQSAHAVERVGVAQFGWCVRRVRSVGAGARLVPEGPLELPTP